METDYQDRIDLYLSGRMPFVDRINFETDLEHNKELQDQYQFTLALQEEFRDRKQKKELIDIWKTDIEDSSGDNDTYSNDDEPHDIITHRHKRTWYRRLGWAAAAILLLLFIIALPDTKQHKNKDFSHIETYQPNTTYDQHIRPDIVKEVSSQERTISNKKLTLKQQKKYWEQAVLYHQNGQRQECVRCLKVLSQQEGIYKEKADSLLYLINK